MRGKTLLITGGTGSFGNEVLKHFLYSDLGEIRIFSRDELKQDNLRHELQMFHPDVANKVKFFIGDVRDPSTLKEPMKGVDLVFHAAALKQVPSCEFFPMEAVKTNILGTNNVLDAAIDNKVECVVCLSTDKAAYPINSMGISKAMEERIATAKALTSDHTRICCTRYGNVMCSRGSVIPLFIEQMENRKPITVTNPNMTRFMMNLTEAVNLVEFAFRNANPGDLFIQKADACKIGDLADAVHTLFGSMYGDQTNIETRIIGTRHGEKVNETLGTAEEMARAEDMGNYFRIPAINRSLNYDNDTQENKEILKAYTSDSANQLVTLDQIISKLLTTDYVQAKVKELL